MSSKDHKISDPSESSYDESTTAEVVSSTDLQKQLAIEKEKANQHWDRLLRQQAEMENLKERVKRDVANAHKYALGEFVLELLPIVDTLERAVTTHSNEESGAGSLLDGINLTLKMFYSSLEKFGVQQVDPMAQPFNPELHQAVSTQVDCDAKPGTVISVLQKGYLLNNRLVRPALVVVSK